MTKEQRLKEEIQKFCETHNLDYEKTEDFANWVKWFCRQDERKKIKNMIK